MKNILASLAENANFYIFCVDEVAVFGFLVLHKAPGKCGVPARHLCGGAARNLIIIDQCDILAFSKPLSVHSKPLSIYSPLVDYLDIGTPL